MMTAMTRSRRNVVAEARIMRWGNSLAIRIPAALAKRAKLDVGTCVELLATAEGFKVQKQPCQPTLEELLSRVTDENRHDAVDWGRPVGNEVW